MLHCEVELKDKNLPNFEFVYMIIHHQLRLEFPNVDQKLILALLRSLLIWGLIYLVLQFNFDFKTYFCTKLR